MSFRAKLSRPTDEGGADVSPDGPARGMLANLTSKLDRRRVSTEKNSRERNALLILESYEALGQGWFWATDIDGQLTYLSGSILETFGLTAETVRGIVFTTLFSAVIDEEPRQRTLPFALAKQTRFVKIALQSAGRTDTRWWELSGYPHHDDDGNFLGFRGVAADITEQRRSSDESSQLAMYDALTGLSNRRRMSNLLEQTLIASRHQRNCAIMLIDLDRFKQVNDTLGHPAGDALLKQVAQRLLELVGDKERVCRLGGDEFQIILPDMDDRGQLGALATAIITGLSQPYSVEGSRCVIGASIGVAVSPFDGATAEQLVRNADLALYAAKDGGRGRFRFFSNEFLEAAKDRRILEEDLRDALAKNELEMHYQPIVCTKSETVIGVEALIRWNHPERGPISPGLFIPIAEEANLIEPIGQFALRRACEDAASWPGELRVAVNVSPIQFGNEALPEIVEAALLATDLKPNRLELEITEGVFLSDSSETDAMFASLKNLGVRLALDDFGTGYSSLGYLRSAPFDKIKIDQSFVRDACDKGSRNGAIIAAIVALAEALDMDTTAEGIECLDQLELMRKLRVSQIQGYVYSAAVSSSTVSTHISGGNWVIAPSGPTNQRNDRTSVYRRAGAVHGDHYYPVVIRNISASGALMEGLLDVPLDTQFVIDFGDGQLAIAIVRRSDKHQQGVEFEQPLVPDGSGGLCTSHRVSTYMLARLGVPSTAAGRADASAVGNTSRSNPPAFARLMD